MGIENINQSINIQELRLMPSYQKPRDQTIKTLGEAATKPPIATITLFQKNIGKQPSSVRFYNIFKRIVLKYKQHQNVSSLKNLIRNNLTTYIDYTKSNGQNFNRYEFLMKTIKTDLSEELTDLDDVTKEKVIDEMIFSFTERAQTSTDKNFANELLSGRNTFIFHKALNEDSLAEEFEVRAQSTLMYGGKNEDFHIKSLIDGIKLFEGPKAQSTLNIAKTYNKIKTLFGEVTAQKFLAQLKKEPRLKPLAETAEKLIETGLEVKTGTEISEMIKSGNRKKIEAAAKFCAHYIGSDLEGATFIKEIIEKADSHKETLRNQILKELDRIELKQTYLPRDDTSIAPCQDMKTDYMRNLNEMVKDKNEHGKFSVFYNDANRSLEKLSLEGKTLQSYYDKDDELTQNLKEIENNTNALKGACYNASQKLINEQIGHQMSGIVMVSTDQSSAAGNQSTILYILNDCLGLEQSLFLEMKEQIDVKKNNADFIITKNYTVRYDMSNPEKTVTFNSTTKMPLKNVPRFDDSTETIEKSLPKEIKGLEIGLKIPFSSFIASK
jgi:hypothetical protein